MEQGLKVTNARVARDAKLTGVAKIPLKPLGTGLEGPWSTLTYVSPPPKKMSIVLIAQPRSGGTSLGSILADVHGCTELNEMYHGSAAQTEVNIRSALLLQPLDNHGFMSDPSVLSPEKLQYISQMEKAKNGDFKGNNPCNSFKLKPDVFASGVLDEVRAEVKELGADTFVFVLIRRNVTAQVLSFAAMKASGDSGRNRKTEVHIDDDILRRSIIEICEQRRFMLTRASDAVLFTEDFGSGRSVRLPTGRVLYYAPREEVPGALEYVHQKIIFDSAESTKRMEEFSRRACSVIDDGASEWAG